MKVCAVRWIAAIIHVCHSPQFIFHLRRAGNPEPPTELAFTDARRLGRIRLCASPLTEPPISELGFDPILCMPPLEKFTQLVSKRSCPIKALLLDQSFSAGVGNWVAGLSLMITRIFLPLRLFTARRSPVSSTSAPGAAMQHPEQSSDGCIASPNAGGL
jgi:formamidopyrimidine-DNA glycosylase